ncbi:uncharacterized protein LOC133832832 [Humulus lupulus]|uniref:uncharacterized protein LOC133832832 n=1 Tax=Humulus lupulus TaxID=3486 RepID=UPI002B40B0AB|nr:uncharacterized protein LOC133832832 [Humulus lupulus]
MDSPNSLNPYDNMSLEDIIIAEFIDDHDDQYFKAFMDGGSSTRQGRRRAHIDRGHSVEGAFTILEVHRCYANVGIGAPADYVDEYVRICETTTIECLVNFVRGVNDIFGIEYLRRPSAGDIRRLLQMGEVCGFPHMLGSIDCMHWEWKNCPVAWKGQFTLGSNNDLNVLNQSPLFTDILQGQAPRVEFMINGTQCIKGYYLADVSFSVNNNNASIQILTGSNYKKWKRDVDFSLGIMDLDRCMREDQPAAPTDASTTAQRTLHAQ